MFTVNSERARALLEKPRFFVQEITSGMRRYPSDSFDLFALVEREGGLVKNLSFAGTVPDFLRLYLESMASLWLRRPGASIQELSLRECEAFLRDRNSIPAMTELTSNEEETVLEIFHWVRQLDSEREVSDYEFSSQKGSFERLSLVDKVKELKAFLGSTQVDQIYQGMARPEVLDVEELTVFVWAPYGSEKEREAFEKLHTLGVQTFGEDRLNFIPEP